LRVVPQERVVIPHIHAGIYPVHRILLVPVRQLITFFRILASSEQLLDPLLGPFNVFVQLDLQLLQLLIELFLYVLSGPHEEPLEVLDVSIISSFHRGAELS